MRRLLPKDRPSGPSSASTYSLPILLIGCFLLFSYQSLAQSNFIFTTAGASGAEGPTQSEVDAEYSGTNLSGNVTVAPRGIQKWIVPASGLYSIKASGASGGNSSSNSRSGGLGASIEGEFILNKDDTLKILVGQKGTDGCGAGGGGGATFIVRNSTILLAAGGGGGAASDNDGADAVTTTSGTNDHPGGGIPGGVNGLGGQACNAASGASADRKSVV